MCSDYTKFAVHAVSIWYLMYLLDQCLAFSKMFFTFPHVTDQKTQLWRIVLREDKRLLHCRDNKRQQWNLLTLKVNVVKNRSSLLYWFYDSPNVKYDQKRNIMLGWTQLLWNYTKFCNIKLINQVVYYRTCAGTKYSHQINYMKLLQFRTWTSPVGVASFKVNGYMFHVINLSRLIPWNE